jgi:hypothetical protein
MEEKAYSDSKFEFSDGLEEWKKRSGEKKLDTGMLELNSLLNGGYMKGIIHILYGSKKPIIHLLLNAAINSLLTTTDGGQNASKIVYVDAENAFNPYYLSEKIRALGYSPELLLKRIMVSRCFNWNQIVEVVAEKVPLQIPNTLIISGMTTMFEYAEKSFEDLRVMIAGIRSILKYNPTIILGTSMHTNSESVPMGGKLLSHLAGVMVSVQEKERYYELSLNKHPYLPPSSVKVWKDAVNFSKKKRENRGKNMSLETFLKIREISEHNEINLNDFDDSINFSWRNL